MSALIKGENLGDSEFKWGKKKGRGAKNSDVQFYESFTYDGVEYKLYDCVLLQKEGEAEPYVGKLIKIWDKPNQPKTVKVHWFFRPVEIWHWLKQHSKKALANELFLASGEGKGLANTTLLEAIVGKCNVVCISNDPRNPQPTRKQLAGADYVFHRTFDVGKCTTSEDFGDKVGDLEAKFVFNQKENEKTEAFKEINNEFKVEDPSLKAKLKRSLESTSGLDGPSKKKSHVNLTMDSNLSSRKEIHEETKSKATLESPRSKDNPSNMTSSTDKSIEKKDMSIDTLDLKVPSHEETSLKKKSALPKEPSIDALDLKVPSHEETSLKKKSALPKEPSINAFDLDLKVPSHEEISLKKKSAPPKELPKEAIVEGRVIDVTRRPDDDEGKWFHLPPWEKRMLAASDQSTLVMLLNLDPEHTSVEVEDIIWHAFREKCSAKVVLHNAFSSPHIGQALLIFKSRDAAERVVKRLNEGCLVLSNQRPLVGHNLVLPKSFGKQPKFAGHLVIDKLKLQQQKDKDAVSTSHCAQPNTIEHELAMEWCLLQARCDIWWKKLYEQHGKQLNRLSGGLKSSN